ncbi:MAG: GPW/gp25 family protein [Balneolaceae bacterium]
MAESKKNRSFLGRGWKFPPSFNRTRRHAEMVEHEEDIREALYIILLTTKGERILQPEFGSDLKRHLFDSITNTKITQLTEDIRRAILMGEPRVICESVEARHDTETDGLLLFKITYVVRSTNNRSNIVFPFYIDEGTSVRLIQQ